MLGTIALTGYLYVVIPKGFFPQQDTGMIIGIAEAAQDISFPAMASGCRRSSASMLKDPAVASVGSQIGASGDDDAQRRPHVHRPEAARPSATPAPTR